MCSKLDIVRVYEYLDKPSYTITFLCSNHKWWLIYNHQLTGLITMYKTFFIDKLRFNERLKSWRRWNEFYFRKWIYKNAEGCFEITQTFYRNPATGYERLIRDRKVTLLNLRIQYFLRKQMKSTIWYVFSSSEAEIQQNIVVKQYHNDCTALLLLKP